jgi:chemotaxis protein MotB
VFQSEVLFPSGGAELNDAGKTEMSKLAMALLDLAKEIPSEINWVLRVDGHTDNVPLSGTGRFADNW